MSHPYPNTLTMNQFETLNFTRSFRYKSTIPRRGVMGWGRFLHWMRGLFWLLAKTVGNVGIVEIQVGVDGRVRVGG
ncbi:hypothetical protein LOAG_16496 [Loa loa]|uniref:Uncharacterized protein n=1 Tax=Loa loa TaxID=7209 RepID=A0A1S0UM38_LOALO|nr:hypothetical protein LOAG_16496 [Loa loa]EJD76623.1 hypothetical protein LOAG_16496 [Loa loa]